MNEQHAEMMPNAVFVYGTLKRGQCRERCWPRTPVSVEPAEVAGLLFDLGAFPALWHGQGRVAGELWHFHEDDMRSVLETLDRIEGYANSPGDLYRRERVAVKCGVGLATAWTYVFADTPPAYALMAGEVVCWPKSSGNSGTRVG